MTSNFPSTIEWPAGLHQLFGDSAATVIAISGVCKSCRVTTVTKTICRFTGRVLTYDICPKCQVKEVMES
jgi:hypothetical protein